MSKNLPALVISGIAISQDAECRFSLNDLHKAAGGEPRHKPVEFLRLDGTTGLINELAKGGDSHLFVETTKGRNGATFVAKELVYRYAMWISPAFELKVIRAYDALATGAASIGVGVDDLIEQFMPTLLQRVGGVVKAISTKQHEESEARMAEYFAKAIAANKQEFDAKLKEVLSSSTTSIRHGKTAGQLWKVGYGFPALKGASPWFSRRLSELGCQVDGNGCSESGGIPSKLFDPDKVAVAMKGGLQSFCKQYVQQRGGQAPLFPKAA